MTHNFNFAHLLFMFVFYCFCQQFYWLWRDPEQTSLLHLNPMGIWSLGTIGAPCAHQPPWWGSPETGPLTFGWRSSEVDKLFHYEKYVVLALRFKKSYLYITQVKDRGYPQLRNTGMILFSWEILNVSFWANCYINLVRYNFISKTKTFIISLLLDPSTNWK